MGPGKAVMAKCGVKKRVSLDNVILGLTFKGKMMIPTT